MIQVSIDEAEVKKLIRQRIAELVKDADAEYVFWDSAELKKRTCMSWDTIRSTFFFDPRFPKYKVGGKWYYPARKTREFLEMWLMEKNRL